MGSELSFHTGVRVIWRFFKDRGRFFVQLTTSCIYYGIGVVSSPTTTIFTILINFLTFFWSRKNSVEGGINGTDSALY